MKLNLAPNNPDRNKLIAGVKDEDLLAAISKSGYPLQTRIAESLSEEFYVQEEWSYLDRDSKSLRNIDILASQALYGYEKLQPRVHPQLNILIECKQSDLPFVFFGSRHPPFLQNFPVLAGLKSNYILIFSDDDNSTWEISILEALGLRNHKFIEDVSFCNTFSKCVRSNKALDFSGDESYNSVIMPLINQLLISSKQICLGQLFIILICI